MHRPPSTLIHGNGSHRHRRPHLPAHRRLRRGGLAEKGGELVAQQMESFRSQYGVEDRVDLLAMTALQFASAVSTTPPAAAESPEAGLPAEQREVLEQLLERIQTALAPRS